MKTDITNFKNSPAGDQLVAYIKELQDELCDVRNMKIVDDVECRARLRAAEILQEYLVDKLKYKNESTGGYNGDEYR